MAPEPWGQTWIRPVIGLFVGGLVIAEPLLLGTSEPASSGPARSLNDLLASATVVTGAPEPMPNVVGARPRRIGNPATPT